MMKALSMICILFAFGIMTVACNSEGSAKDDMQYVEEEKATLREEIQEVKMKIDARLTQLGREMEEAGEEAKIEIQTEMSRLEERGREFDAKLEQIENVTEEAWSDFKHGVKTTIDELKRDLESK